MKIDFRRKNQRIGKVYVWSTKIRGLFDVGINGTPHHYGGLTKAQTVIKVSELQFIN